MARLALWSGYAGKVFSVAAPAGRSAHLQPLCGDQHHGQCHSLENAGRYQSEGISRDERFGIHEIREGNTDLTVLPEITERIA